MNDMLIQAAPSGSALAVYLEELERRVALLEAQLNPPEPDPLEVGTAVFRQMNKAKKSLQRRS